MTSDSPPPPQELNFPPVRVDHSLTKLDLDTLMMRSLATPRAEEPGSSLDDSTYELLGDSQFETSDDEAHTASIASTDDRTPDDASEFSDDDNDDDFGMQDANEQDSSYLPHDESEHDAHTQSAVSGDSSILTEIPSHMEDSDSVRQIKLDEQLVEDSNTIQGSKSVKSYWTHESPEVFGRYDCKEVRLVVRAALSERPMTTPDAYRVLYIGMPDKWLEDTIVAKLGEALTASPCISKSVVVRGQVEPYNPPIHVWRCTEFQPIVENGDATHLLAILDDGQRLRFGPKLKSTNLGRPDLVVFCHPTIPGVEKHEFVKAEKVLRREKIPCINIGQIRSHGEGLSTYDSETLAMCVEGRDAVQDEFQLKEVLPLDHFAFSQLDALQLNRHLASISPHLALQSDKKNDIGMHGSWWRNVYNKISKTIGLRGSLLNTLTLILLSLIVMPAILQGVGYAPGLYRDFMSRSREIEGPSLGESSSLCVSPHTQMILTPSSSIKPITTPAHSGLSLTAVRAEALKRRSKKTEAKPWQYEIQGTSDHQFVLKPSEGSIINHKKPQLRISVAQEGNNIPIQFNRTIDGEYIVDLIRDYPLGVFNVSIVSYSKPKLLQSFEIVLGHDKSKLDLLLDLAKARMFDTQLFITNISSIAMHHFKAGFSAVDSVASSLANDTERSRQQATRHLRDVQVVLRRKMQSNQMVLKMAPLAAWVGMWQATAPIRTSTPMIRARNNALRLRCKMEEAAGFSNTAKDQESWACAKLRDS